VGSPLNLLSQHFSTKTFKKFRTLFHSIFSIFPLLKVEIIFRSKFFQFGRPTRGNSNTIISLRFIETVSYLGAQLWKISSKSVDRARFIVRKSNKHFITA